jgi:chloramphenicol 3-O-phosphotransferase
MMSGRLVIVGGAPATGKTTLALALGASRDCR